MPSSEAVVVFTIGASLLTTTSCKGVPTSSEKFKTASWPTLRTNPFCVVDLNPDNSTLRSYGPTGSAAKRYAPVSLVKIERDVPVSPFWAVTVAPGTNAPEASFTVPRIVPVGNSRKAEPPLRTGPAPRQTTQRDNPNERLPTIHP